MNCLDSSFLIDYLNGKSAPRAYLDDNPTAAFYATSHVLFEIYDGVGERTDRAFDDLDDALDWVTPLPFTAESSREAITIKQELKANGTPINLKDVFIAGTVREAGGTIVTRDGHFEHVEGLPVESY